MCGGLNGVIDSSLVTPELTMQFGPTYIPFVCMYTNPSHIGPRVLGAGSTILQSTLVGRRSGTILCNPGVSLPQPKQK